MPKGYRGKMSLWFYSAFLLLMVPMRSVLGANVPPCQAVRYQYSAQGMDVYEVPLTPQEGKFFGGLPANSFNSLNFETCILKNSGSL